MVCKYLGTKYENFEMKYVVENNSKNLSSWPKPIALDKSIDDKTLDKLLKILNEEGSFYIDEVNETKVVTGRGRMEDSGYYTIFGETEESLAHEGPFFKGPDGRTEGFFSFYNIKPKTDTAIVFQRNDIHHPTGVSKKGTVYFLKKSKLT